MKVNTVTLNNRNKGYYTPSAAETGMLNNKTNTAFKGKLQTQLATYGPTVMDEVVFRFVSFQGEDSNTVSSNQFADKTQFKKALKTNTLGQRVLKKLNTLFDSKAMPVFDKNDPRNSQIPWVRSFLF